MHLAIPTSPIFQRLLLGRTFQPALETSYRSAVLATLASRRLLPRRSLVSRELPRAAVQRGRFAELLSAQTPVQNSWHSAQHAAANQTFPPRSMVFLLPPLVRVAARRASFSASHSSGPRDPLSSLAASVPAGLATWENTPAASRP